jgi:D-alanine-D-alanine ligase
MIRVGVMRGGISSEYEVSLNTGANVLSHLRSDAMKDTYKAHDILIDKEGVFHMNGRPVTLEQISKKIDVIFNALHGDFGEDGKIQQILEQWKIPYTGSGPYPSAVGYNKLLAKKEFSRLGIQTPQFVILKNNDGEIGETATEKAKYIWSKMGPPWVAKPVASGSSVGVRICKTFSELVEAIETSEGTDLFIEEMIEGKEATVPVIEKFRGQQYYVLPPIEIRIPKHKTFFDYEVKYGDSSSESEIVPGVFSQAEKSELIRLATLVHQGLNLDHYSRTDFIIHPRRGIYALEVNTLPGLSHASLTPKALTSVGASMGEFIDHILTLALNRHK